MKSFIIAVSMLATVGLYAQTKDLTLADAVYNRNLIIPSTLPNLQFVENTSNIIYYNTDNRSFSIEDANGKQIKTINLSEIQAVLPSLNRLPILDKVDAQYLYFSDNNIQYSYDYLKGKMVTIKSPDGAENQDFNTKNQLVAFTKDNNLNIVSQEKETAVTENKNTNIVSGQAIHRNEFGIEKGTFWSPNGTFLAFYQKDVTHVNDYPLVDDSTYPAKADIIKYPMAGTGSEKAKIGIFDTQKQSTTYLDINTEDEHYLTNLTWSPDEKYILVAELNRDQNKMQLNRYEVASGKKINTITEEQNDKWVEPEKAAVFLPNDNENFLWFSEKDGFMNLYQYNLSGKFIQQITKFKWVVENILGFDAQGKSVILSGTGEDPRNTQVFKVNLKTLQATNLTPESGTHNATLSSDGNYLIDNFSSLTIPRKIQLINVNTLETKKLLEAENPLKDYHIGTTELVKIKAKDGTDLYGRMIKPSNFDAFKKYPVLVYVYGGPHAQMVTNSWLGGASLWMQQFADAKQYIVFTVDNRGSENRGFAFESVIHRNLGTNEMEDQIQGVNYLKSLPNVDANRIAIHGWSFGGFMTSSLMTRYPDVFKVGVAGGPVTDWKFYEIMYGERYMDTPQQNPEGYQKARIANYIKQLKGKLLIIHGSVDATVVPQHSMDLLKASVDNGVQLDFFTYPLHEHNVRGKDRIHLMQKVLDYIAEYNR